MKTTNYVIASAISAVIYAVLFYCIINYVIPTIFYSSHVMKSAEDNDGRMLLFALMLSVFGMCFFIIRALPDYNRTSAGAVYGAVYSGFVMAVYNCLNKALLTSWDLKGSVVNTIAAMAVGALAGGIAVYVYDSVGNKKRRSD